MALNRILVGLCCAVLGEASIYAAHPKLAGLQKCVSSKGDMVPHSDSYMGGDAKTDVEKIYFISMDENRANTMQRHLNVAASNVQHARFQAVTEKDMENLDFFKKHMKQYSTGKTALYMKQNYKKTTRLATAAIYMSHAKVLEQIYWEARDKDTAWAKENQASGLDEHMQELDQMREHTTRWSRADDNKWYSQAGEKPYLVLEDDAQLVDGWQPKLKEIVRNTPNDWNLIRIGYWGDRRCSDSVNNFVLQVNHPSYENGKYFYQGNTGYLVRPKMIPALLQALYDSDVQDVDGALMSGGATGSANCQAANCPHTYAVQRDQMLVEDTAQGSMRWDGTR